MYSNDLLTRITLNPAIMAGKPTIRGLRITVEQILKALAADIPVQDILADYPELEHDDIKAALLYAADSLMNEQVFDLRLSA